MSSDTVQQWSKGEVKLYSSITYWYVKYWRIKGKRYRSIHIYWILGKDYNCCVESIWKANEVLHQLRSWCILLIFTYYCQNYHMNCNVIIMKASGSDLVLARHQSLVICIYIVKLLFTGFIFSIWIALCQYLLSIIVCLCVRWTTWTWTPHI